ncbi:hypothetical protein EAF00_009715 [Botryotinia globosa]|nr:hypothetical protein EAF00_009715 [Botryotinia globosa]
MISFPTFGSFTDCAKSMGFIHHYSRLQCAGCSPPKEVATLSLNLSKRRERLSSFGAFLPKKIALDRQNLTICTNALVSSIVFTQGKGLPRTEKILFKSSDRKSESIYSVRVNKEVIVCSGAIGSPQVLMLRKKERKERKSRSGISLRESLEEHGIKLVHDLPGVGSTLTEHHKASTKHYNPQSLIPNIELMPFSTSGMDTFDEPEFINTFSKTRIFCVLATILQPRSNGTIHLASSNPHDKPKVDFGILSDPSDYTIARSVRLRFSIVDRMKNLG